MLEVINEACPTSEYRGKGAPDCPRCDSNLPFGKAFKGIFAQIGTVAEALDVMIALGTHQPMSEEAICHRLEISLEERRGKYGSVRLFNHEWDNTSALKYIGTIPASDIKYVVGGLFAMDRLVNVTVAFS